MTLLRQENRRTLLVVFTTCLVVFEIFAYVATTPMQGERFFQLYVLGANKLTEDYYPTNPTLIPGEQINWYVGVSNFMGNVQLVEIRVKLANMTFGSPDDVHSAPSTAPEIGLFDRFINGNETWEFPLVWTITSAVRIQDTIRIDEIRVGNQTGHINVSSRNGFNFRIILELWTLDGASNEFQYGWTTKSIHRSAWLQVWFNATTSRSLGQLTYSTPSSLRQVDNRDIHASILLMGDDLSFRIISHCQHKFQS